MKKIVKLKQYIKNGLLFDKIFCYFLIRLGYSNMKIQVYQVRNKQFNKLKHKYKKILNKKYLKTSEIGINKNVWVCWLQGKENAPAEVKKCIASIYKRFEKSSIIFIDQFNYKDYIDIPDYIEKKWENGIIPNALFSDIIRTLLLIEYGGLWIDATTMLLDDIPKYVYKNDFFMFDMRGEDDILIYNNWFIYSKKDCHIFKYERDFLFEYWKKESKVREYFIWHLFMRMIYEKFPDDFKNIEYYPHSITHMLHENIYNKVDDKYLISVKKICPIQKLTYKIDYTKLSEESLYNKIFKEDDFKYE